MVSASHFLCILIYRKDTIWCICIFTGNVYSKTVLNIFYISANSPSFIHISSLHLQLFSNWKIDKKCETRKIVFLKKIEVSSITLLFFLQTSDYKDEK